MERVDAQTPQEIIELCYFPYTSNLEEVISMYGKNITILDIACGGAEQWIGLREQVKEVLLMDANPVSSIIQKADILEIPLGDAEVDIVFCFETIEHIRAEDQVKVIRELDRVSNLGFIVGSINKSGPNFIDGIEIYKGDKNPYHLAELDHCDFPDLFVNHPQVELFRSMFNATDHEFYTCSGLTVDGYCNYGIVLK